MAALLGEPAAAEVEALLRDARDPPRLCASGVAEIVDVLVRGRGLAEIGVTEKLEWLRLGGLEIVPVDDRIAMLAGSLRARHYHRRVRPISLGDCLALATARFLTLSIATSDAPMAAVARIEGIPVVALPDSNGVRP